MRAPAQKTNAYAALKLGGKRPGHRLRARTRANTQGSAERRLRFTGAGAYPGVDKRQEPSAGSTPINQYQKDG